VVGRRIVLISVALLALRCVGADIVATGVIAGVKRPDEYPETKARVVLEKYDEAWLSKNVKAFDALLSPSYLYFTSTGGVMERKAMLAMLASPDYKIDSGSRDDVRVMVTDSTAILSTLWRGKGTFQGKPFTDDQRCSVVISLGSKAEVLSEHCTNLQ